MVTTEDTVRHLTMALKLMSERVTQLEAWLMAAQLQPVPKWAAHTVRRSRLLHHSVSTKFSADTRAQADAALAATAPTVGVAVPLGLTDPFVPVPAGLDLPQVAANFLGINKRMGSLVPSRAAELPPEVLRCAVTTLVCRGGIDFTVPGGCFGADDQPEMVLRTEDKRLLPQLLLTNIAANAPLTVALLSARVFAVGFDPNSITVDESGQTRGAVVQSRRQQLIAADDGTVERVYAVSPWTGDVARLLQNRNPVTLAVRASCVPVLQYLLAHPPTVDDMNAGGASLERVLNDYPLHGFTRADAMTRSTVPPSGPVVPCPLHEANATEHKLYHCAHWSATLPLHAAIAMLCEAYPSPALLAARQTRIVRSRHASADEKTTAAEFEAAYRVASLAAVKMLLRCAYDDGSGLSIDALVTVVSHTPGARDGNGPPRKELGTVSLHAFVTQCVGALTRDTPAAHRDALIEVAEWLAAIATRRTRYRATIDAVLADALSTPSALDGGSSGVGSVTVLRTLIRSYVHDIAPG